MASTLLELRTFDSKSRSYWLAVISGEDVVRAELAGLFGPG